MSLAPDQELRRDLLLFALGKQHDLQAAIAMAIEMEQFVLQGSQAAAKDQPATPPAAQPAGPRPGNAVSGAAPNTGAAPCAKRPAQAAASQPVLRSAFPGGGLISSGEKRRWSDADDAHFKELWASDLSLEEISEDMNRTVPSLYSRARSMGLPRRAPRVQERSKPAESAPADRQEDRSAAAAVTDKPETEGLPRGLRAVQGAVRRADIGADRYPPSRNGALNRPGNAKRPCDGSNGAGRSAASTERFADRSVDPVIQFLRSRDYSVVRVGEGRFQLDGRHILSADELREKANNVRKALGQSPFLQLAAEQVG